MSAGLLVPLRYRHQPGLQAGDHELNEPLLPSLPSLFSSLLRVLGWMELAGGRDGVSFALGEAAAGLGRGAKGDAGQPELAWCEHGVRGTR